jgi:hypothetical protein
MSTITLCGGDDDVHLAGLLCVHGALRGLEAFAHDLGVTAAARAFFFKVHFDELTTQRHDLVGHLGAGVVGAHDGAQAGGSANGGQTRHTGTGDEHLGRRHFACGRDLAIEETTKGIGGFDHSAVAAHTGHRGQRVHLLGAAEGARECVDRQRRDLFSGQLLHQIGILGGPQEANQRLAFVHQRHFVGGRGSHLEDDVTAAPKIGRARRNGSTRFNVSLVGQVGLFARTFFYHHGKAEFEQLAHHIGHRGHPFFTGENLSRHANALRRGCGFACLHECLLALHRKRERFQLNRCWRSLSQGKPCIDSDTTCGQNVAPCKPIGKDGHVL